MSPCRHSMSPVIPCRHVAMSPQPVMSPCRPTCHVAVQTEGPRTYTTAE
jgi:hypothetical protein